MNDEGEKQQALFRNSERRRLEARHLRERAQRLIEDSQSLIAGSHEYLRLTQAKQSELMRWIEQAQTLHHERERPRSSDQ